MVKVSDRLAKEETEIDEQLEVIKEQLMKFSDIKHAIETGTRNKDVRRMVQIIDIIEINTRGVLVFTKFPSIRARLRNRRANSAQACNTVYWNLHGWIVFAWLNETSTFW